MWMKLPQKTRPSNDVIIGPDLLEDLGIDLTYSDQTHYGMGPPNLGRERGTLIAPGVNEMLHH